MLIWSFESEFLVLFVKYAGEEEEKVEPSYVHVFYKGDYKGEDCKE